VRPAPAWLTAANSPDHDSAHRTRRRPHDEVAPTPLELPAHGISGTGGQAGVVDLGTDGLAVIAVCSTVNFSLRTPREQEALVSSFARYLHSLTAPVQFLIRAERLDLAPAIAELRARAGGLPHPALEAAARDHADYLDELTQHADLLRRQVLLVLREPTRTAASDSASDSASGTGLGRPPWRRSAPGGEVDPGARQAAEQRLVRRLTEAADLLAPAGIVVTPLDASAATGVLAAACNPDTFLPPSAGLAGADEVVTSTTTFTDLYNPDEHPATRRQRTAGAGDSATRTSPRSTTGAGPWLAADEDWDYDDDRADHDDTEGR
jgi:hypothetical protein